MSKNHRQSQERSVGSGPEKDPAPAPVETSAYHVVGPGAVGYGGDVHPAGAALELTKDEARGLGASVAPGPAPKPSDGAPKAGKYRVTAFGSIQRDGKLHSKGAVLELTEAEAKDFADRIAPA